VQYLENPLQPNSQLKRVTGMGQLRVRGRPAVFTSLLLKIAGWDLLRAARMRELLAGRRKSGNLRCVGRQLDTSRALYRDSRSKLARSATPCNALGQIDRFPARNRICKPRILSGASWSLHSFPMCILVPTEKCPSHALRDSVIKRNHDRIHKNLTSGRPVNPRLTRESQPTGPCPESRTRV